MERDSAGVRIVEISDIYGGALPTWRLSDQPIVTIGQTSGAAEYELFQVRSATTSPTGQIAVANGGSGEIRVYDGSGRHLLSFGGMGGGPGEFRELSWHGATADGTLVTYDSRSRRVTWFTPRGEAIRESVLEPPAIDVANPTQYGIASLRPLGLLEGRALLRAGYTRRTGEGEYRDPVHLVLYGDQGAPTETLGTYRDWEAFFHRAPSGMTAALPVVFGREALSAAFADRVVVGSNDRFELDVFDGTTLSMRIIAHLELPTTTAAEVDAWLRDHHERVNGASQLEDEFSRLVRETIDLLPARSTPPAFRDLAVDSGRFIWVAAPHRTPTATSEWVVLTTDGHPAARVQIPTELEILEIGADYLLALRRDEQDVEQVLRFALERDAKPPT